jgi:hypothetical protein
MFHSRLKGRDLHSPSNEIVENQTGVTIPALRVIRLLSQGTVYPQVTLANPSLYVNFAVTYDAIPNGKSGQACAFGFMVGVDTSVWPVGTILYSDNSGNLTTVANGGIVALVIKQDPEDGVMYVTTESNGSGGSSNAWRLTGNISTNENTNFLGTTDNQDLRFKTNNQLNLNLTKQGRLGLGPNLTTPDSHFHQKSHTGYSKSGLRQETFALTTNSNSFEQACAVNLPNPSVVRIEYVVVGRSADGTKRCMFKRTGLFYRELGNVENEGIWLSDQTIKSDNNLDVGYAKTVSDVILTVKGASSDPMYWTGHVMIEVLVDNT